MKLIFASNNQHKIEEIRSVIGQNAAIEIVTLEEAGINIKIPEPFETLEENATNKSKTIYELTKAPLAPSGCFSEDTGLEVDDLKGEPGVRSARYAGEEKSFDKNIAKLLHNLQGHTNRSAQFRTVISLIMDDREVLFEGICRGTILHERRGNGGFAYDSIFVPEGGIHTFAEMNMEEKNRFSHRRKAIDKLVAHLLKDKFHQVDTNQKN